MCGEQPQLALIPFGAYAYLLGGVKNSLQVSDRVETFKAPYRPLRSWSSPLALIPVFNESKWPSFRIQNLARSRVFVMRKFSPSEA